MNRLLSLLLLVALGAAGVLYLWGDGQQLARAADNLSAPRAAVPILATLASYILMSLSYEGIARAAGHSLGFARMVRITFVSNTINYIVATGGLSGFAARMFLFRQGGIPLGPAVTISFVQGLVTNVTLIGFLIAGFTALLGRATLEPSALVSAAAALLIFTLGVASCVVVILRPHLRRRLLLRATLLGHRAAVRLAPSRAPSRAALWRLQHNIDRGLQFLVERWPAMIVPTLWILLDWVVTLGVLWSCFWAVGINVSFPLIAVGFAIGILFSMISVLPAGLGLMEGSLTTVFVSMGLPFEATLIAVLLFRVVYFGIPFGISLTAFHGALEQARHTPPAAAEPTTIPVETHRRPAPPRAL